MKARSLYPEDSHVLAPWFISPGELTVLYADDDFRKTRDEFYSLSSTQVSTQVTQELARDRERTHEQAVVYAQAVVRGHMVLRALEHRSWKYIAAMNCHAQKHGDHRLAVDFLRRCDRFVELFAVAQIADFNFSLPAHTAGKLDNLLDTLQAVISGFRMKSDFVLLLTSFAVNAVLFYKGGCTFTVGALALTNFLMTVGIPADMFNKAVSFMKDLAAPVFTFFSGDAHSQAGESPFLALGSLVVGLLSVGMLKTLPDAKLLTEYAQHFSVWGRALNGVTSIQKTVTDVLSTTFSWCYEKWYGIPYDLSSYEAAVPELKQYFDEVAELMVLEERNKIQGSVEACKKVEDVYVKGLGIQRKLASLSAPPQIMQTFQTHHQVLAKIYAEVDRSGAFNSGPRIPPVVVQLFGGSGVGKSGCAYPLMQDVLRVDGLHTDWANHIYQRNAEQDFWDGYTNQRVCYYDDFGQIRDTQTGPNPEFMEIIRTANIAPFPLHRAELQEKAKSRFTSRFVLLTSNCQTFPTPSLTCPSAFLRRLDFAYKVEVEPDVAYQQVVDGRVEKRIDPVLVERKYGTPMSLDIYRFYKVDKQSLLVSDTIMTYDQIVAEIVAAYRSRFHDSNNVVDFLNQRVAQVGSHFYGGDSDAEDECQEMLDANAFNDDEECRVDADYLKRCALDGELLESKPLSFTWKIFTAQSQTVIDAVRSIEWSDPLAAFSLYKLKDRLWVLADKVDEVYNESPQIRWLRERARKSLDFATSWISSLWEKAKACPYKMVFGALAVIVTLLVKFWPKQQGCRMTEAIKKVIVSQTHWNVIGCFGTRACFAKCNVCSAMRAGGMPVLTPNRTVEDVVREMVQKVQHLPEITGVACESNDNQTKKVVTVNVESNDNLTPKVKTVVVESNDNLTRKVSKVVVEANTEKSLIPVVVEEQQAEDPVAHLALDQNAFELFNHKVLRNTYQVVRERDGKQVYLMNCCFLKGVTAITAGHITNHLAAGDIVHLRNVYLKQITLPWSSIQVVRAKDDDMCLLVFPDTFVPLHADMTGHIIDDNNLVNVDGGSVTLVSIRNQKIADKVEAVPTFLNSASIDAHYRTLEYTDIVAGKKLVQMNYYSYGVDSQCGDCGGLVGIRTNLIQRKLVGLHVAGSQGKGYAVPLSQKRVQALLNAVPKIAQVSFDVDFSPVNTPPGNFVPLYSVADGVSTGGVSSLLQTPLYDQIYPHGMDRSILRPINGVDPMQRSLEKAGGPLVYICPGKIDIVENAVANKLKIDGECQVLTYQESIEGVVGDRWICPINRSASAGYPWSKSAKGWVGKTKWLGAGESYDFSNAELLSAVEDAERKMEQGERPLFIFQDSLKDEKRSLAKIQAMKTRTFAACPLPLIILFRKYFLSAVKEIMVGRNFNEVSVGTNVYANDWGDIANLLRSKGKKVIAGDFSNFDGSLQPQILYAVLRILERFYANKATEREIMIRRMLFFEVVNSIHICGDNVYMWTHSQPSGGPLTVIINSIYNMLVMRLCWLDLAPAGSTMKTFDDHVALVTYGDDNCANISDVAIEYYNQNSISTVMTRYGMTYTDESKSTEMVDYRSLSEISFLKRSFVQRGFFWDSPLSREALTEMVQWTRKCIDIDAATVDNVETACLEWALHGKEVFDEETQKLSSACKRLLKKQPFVLTFVEYLSILDSHKVGTS